MTKKELKELVRFWQGALGLGQWTIDVRVAVIDEPIFANNTRSTRYDACVLTFQPWMLGKGKRPQREDMIPVDLTPNFVEMMVVHELLHCVLRDYTGAVDALDGQMHRDAYTQFEANFQRADEQTVDRLARALVLAFGQTKGEK